MLSELRNRCNKSFNLKATQLKSEIDSSSSTSTCFPVHPVPHRRHRTARNDDCRNWDSVTTFRRPSLLHFYFRKQFSICKNKRDRGKYGTFDLIKLQKLTGHNK